MRRFLAAFAMVALVVTAGCMGFSVDTSESTPTPVGDAPAPEPAVQPPDRPGDGATGRVITGQPAPADERAAVAADREDLAAMGGLSMPGDAGTITVAGTGQVSADPELALVYVTVEARAETADAARDRVASDVSRMRTALRDSGVPDDAVRTTSYYLSPRYDYSNERQELVGYVASHSFEIEVDVTEAGPVVDTAVGNGADQVGGVQFTLTDETREDLRREALAAAVADARLDADAIATAADVTITGVHSASTSGPVVTPYYGRVAMEAAGADTTFDTGPVTVSAGVTIAYTLE